MVRLQGRLLLAFAVMMVALSVSIGSAARPVLQTPAPPVSEEEAARIGEKTTIKICTECHELDQVIKDRRTPQGWKEMVTTMADKGAIATTAEFATARQYLTRYYGIVAVNTAAAADLTAVLGLSPAAAEAVVAYRTTHGKFADLDALAKVPGLDRKKLEEQVEALRFD